MKKDNKNIDDHHCSVIENERLKVELAECDKTFNNKKDRDECQTKFKETSKKREQACKFS